MKNKSIIYVNYSPYENSGHIFDYLLENFDRVFLFSIAFHDLKTNGRLNKLSIYENGKLTFNEFLPYLKVPQSMVFLLIPVRSLINILQIFFKIVNITKKYGRIHTYLSVNAFTSVLGILLVKLKFINRSIFWVWDYYPISHPNMVVRIMRWLYWQCDKLATKSTKVAYSNLRLVEVRKIAGVISKKENCTIVPIAMGDSLPIKDKRLTTIKLGFVGVLKKSQGLDMLFDCANILKDDFKNISFEIIGSGPDEFYFKNRAKKLRVPFTFYGLVSDEKLKKILYDCTLGIAPYTPEDSNVSRYGDPSKVKNYLEFNLPAIMTDVFEFSKELTKKKAGIVIKYGDSEGMSTAIQKIISKYNYYVTNVLRLHSDYHYKKVYKKLFEG